MARFLLGINYWPRRSAMYMWQRFDLGEIREDAARIKEPRPRRRPLLPPVGKLPAVGTANGLERARAFRDA